MENDEECFKVSKGCFIIWSLLFYFGLGVSNIATAAVSTCENKYYVTNDPIDCSTLNVVYMTNGITGIFTALFGIIITIIEVMICMQKIDEKKRFGYFFYIMIHLGLGIWQLVMYIRHFYKYIPLQYDLDSESSKFPFHQITIVMKMCFLVYIFIGSIVLIYYLHHIFNKCKLRIFRKPEAVVLNAVQTQITI